MLCSGVWVLSQLGDLYLVHVLRNGQQGLLHVRPELLREDLLPPRHELLREDLLPPRQDLLFGDLLSPRRALLRDDLLHPLLRGHLLHRRQDMLPR